MSVQLVLRESASVPSVDTSVFLYIYILIHLFIKYLLNNCYVLCILHDGKTFVNKESIASPVELWVY